MPEITNRDSLEARLRIRPPEDAVLIAVRTALRLLPLIGQVLDTDTERRRATALLPALRALRVATVAGTRPKLAVQLREAAQAAARAATAAAQVIAPTLYTIDRYDALAQIAFAASGAVEAAAYAADSVRAMADADAEGVATNFSYSAQLAWAAHNAQSATYPAGWPAVLADTTALEGGSSQEALGTSQLWPASLYDGSLTYDGSFTYAGAPARAAEHWRALRQQLLDAGEGWEIWTDWYDAILAGRPLDPKLELKKALIPDEVWKQGPAAVNAEIARLIAEHKVSLLAEDRVGFRADFPLPAGGQVSEPDVPLSRPAALHFAMRDGRLGVAQPPASPLPSGVDDGWFMLHESVSELLGQPSIGNSPLRQSLEAVLRALGDGVADLNPLRLGLVGIAMQEFARRADEILLPEDAARLHAIVIQQQLLLGRYPEWLDYQAALAPAVADPGIEQAAANKAAEIAEEMIELHPDAFEPEAAQAIADASEIATPEPTADDPAPVAPPEARRGWIRVFGEAIRSLALDFVQEGRKLAIKGVIATGATVIASVGAKLTGLADLLPAEFGWLKSLATYVSALVGV